MVVRWLTEAQGWMAVQAGRWWGCVGEKQAGSKPVTQRSRFEVSRGKKRNKLDCPIQAAWDMNHQRSGANDAAMSRRRTGADRLCSWWVDARQLCRQDRWGEWVITQGRGDSINGIDQNCERFNNFIRFHVRYKKMRLIPLPMLSIW